ncbi:MAG: polysaccharide deacetylase family protein [Verrucomicrobia bacterium]|nr:polysaccharide deacetylase family protein [Verrucomicrobiota bacterium]
MRIVTLFEEQAFASANGNPFLMMHKVGDLPKDANRPQLYVSAPSLRRLLVKFRRHGFQAVLPSALTTGNLSKCFAVSFDDGYETTLTIAAPMMTEMGISAINYLVPDRFGQTNIWDRGRDSTPGRLMDRGQVKEWLALGHEIGAHTLTHPDLRSLSLSEAREEIVGSKKKLEDWFGREVRHFAFPYGYYDNSIVELVLDAGLTTAATTVPGLVQAGDDPFRLKRYNVDGKSIVQWVRDDLLKQPRLWQAKVTRTFMQG